MAQTPMVVIKHDAKIPIADAKGNIVNFCSWGRLVDELRASGNIKKNEEVVCFEITTLGLNIRMRLR